MPTITPPRAGRNQDSVTSIPKVGTRGSIGIPGHEDMVRKRLAYSLIILLAGIVAVGFGIFVAGAILDWGDHELTSLIQLFFTSVLTLVSTVIGFYFGSEHRRGRPTSKDDAV